jgi:hypothetical protein
MEGSMIEEEKAAFTVYLAGLAEIFDVSLSKMRIDLYFEALKDLPIEQFVLACNYHTQTGKFFPKPSELREALNGRSSDRAVLAFEEMRAAVRSIGAYKSVSFTDKTTMAVIQAFGGWLKVCDTPSGEWKWLEKDFIKAYEAMQGREIETPTSLPGIVEQENFARMNIEDIEPVTISQPEKRQALTGSEVRQ